MTISENGGEAVELWVLCRMAREDICMFRYTMEAYEGLCVTTTLPGRGGWVRLSTERGRWAELEEVLAGFSAEMNLEILEWGEGPQC